MPVLYHLPINASQVGEGLGDFGAALFKDLIELGINDAQATQVKATLAAARALPTPISHEQVEIEEKYVKDFKELIPGAVVPEIHRLVGPRGCFAQGTEANMAVVDMAHFPTNRQHMYGAPDHHHTFKGKKSPAVSWPSSAPVSFGLERVCATAWQFEQIMSLEGVKFQHVHIVDLFPRVAMPREGGLHMSQPRQKEAALVRLVSILEQGGRVISESSRNCVEAIIALLEEMEGVVHHDCNVPFLGSNVRTHVFLDVPIPGGQSSTAMVGKKRKREHMGKIAVILLGSDHRCLQRMSWISSKIVRRDLAFQSLMGTSMTSEQIQTAFRWVV